MSSILNQLIRWEANFVDRANAPTKSLHVDFTIEDNNEEDDGDNDPSNEKAKSECGDKEFELDFDSDDEDKDE